MTYGTVPKRDWGGRERRRQRVRVGVRGMPVQTARNVWWTRSCFIPYFVRGVSTIICVFFCPSPSNSLRIGTQRQPPSLLPRSPESCPSGYGRRDLRNPTRCDTDESGRPGGDYLLSRPRTPSGVSSFVLTLYFRTETLSSRKHKK